MLNSQCRISKLKNKTNEFPKTTQEALLEALLEAYPLTHRSNVRERLEDRLEPPRKKKRGSGGKPSLKPTSSTQEALLEAYPLTHRIAHP